MWISWLRILCFFFGKRLLFLKYASIFKMVFRHRLGEIKKMTLKPGQIRPQVSNLGRFKSIQGVISRPTPHKKRLRPRMYMHEN